MLLVTFVPPRLSLHKSYKDPKGIYRILYGPLTTGSCEITLDPIPRILNGNNYNPF